MGTSLCSYGNRVNWLWEKHQLLVPVIPMCISRSLALQFDLFMAVWVSQKSPTNTN